MRGSCGLWPALQPLCVNEPAGRPCGVGRQGGLYCTYMAAILNRGYDSTPEFLRFGRLQTVLAEKARYLKRIEPPPGVVLGYDRWRTISYE